MNHIVARLIALPFLFACLIALAVPPGYAAATFILGGAVSLALFAGELLTRARAHTVAIPLVAFAGFPLVLLSAVSLLWYPERLHSFIGDSFDMQSIAVLGAGACVFGIGVALGRAKHTDVILRTLEWGGALYAIWVMGALFGFVPVASLATEWESVAFLLAGACSIAILAASVSPDPQRIWHIALALLSGFGIVILSLPAVMLAFELGVFAALLIAWRWRDARAIPLIVAGLLIAAVYLSGVRAPLIPVEGTLRPSYSASSYLMTPLYFDDLHSMIFGTGIGSYGSMWNRNRPEVLNDSARWTDTPGTAVSTGMTLALEGGLLSIGAIILVFAVALGGVVSSAREEDTRHRAIASGALILIAGVACFSFVLSAPSFLLAMLVCGLAASPLGSSMLHLRSTQWRRVALGTFLLCCVLVSLWLAVRLVFATQAESAGYARGRAGAIQEAATLFNRAAGLWPTEIRYETAARTYAELVLSGESASTTADTELAKLYARRASVFAPRSFDAQLEYGSIFTSLAQRGDTSAITEARQALQVAHWIGPTRPDPLYIEAELDLLAGDAAAAHDALTEALRLKADYAEAQALLSSISASTTPGVVQ